MAAVLVVGGVVWFVGRRVLPGTPAFVAAAAGAIIHELLDAPVATAFAQAGL